MSTTTEIKLWVGGMSPALRDYQIELVETSLERTAKQYPPYHISYNHRPMSAERSKIETERGVNVHAHFASEWLGQFVDSSKVTLINYPFMKDRLGLRKCITLKKLLPRFQALKTGEAFKALRIGQQRGWSDISTYTHHGMEVVESEDYQSLFAMLQRERYECLPMSVLEIDRALNDQLKHYPDFTIVPNVYIFYPIPVYLSVSRFQPELAKRLTKGLGDMYEDGTVDALFKRHYNNTDINLSNTAPRVFILNNPLIPVDKNTKVINSFITSRPHISAAIVNGN